MVPQALMTLGYGDTEIEDIITYVVGHGTLAGAPFIDHAALRAKGFTAAAIAAVEQGLAGAFDIRHIFNRWTLSEAFCRDVLGFTGAQLDDVRFDLLAALGFSREQI